MNNKLKLFLASTLVFFTVFAQAYQDDGYESEYKERKIYITSSAGYIGAVEIKGIGNDRILVSAGWGKHFYAYDHGTPTTVTIETEGFNGFSERFDMKSFLDRPENNIHFKGTIFNPSYEFRYYSE